MFLGSTAGEALRSPMMTSESHWVFRGGTRGARHAAAPRFPGQGGGTAPRLLSRCLPKRCASAFASLRPTLPTERASKAQERQPSEECRSELPCPPPGDLPNLQIGALSPALAGGFSTTEPPGKPPFSSNSFKWYHDNASVSH